ncbi:MAG: hypothetical protein K6G44_04270 [Lentisphaeria bacterium]|nr:hypothetical protein [Lentisphaeria bacterium]
MEERGRLSEERGRKNGKREGNFSCTPRTSRESKHIGLWPIGLTIWFSGSSRMAGDSGGEREVNPEERGSKNGGVREQKRRREGGKSGRKREKRENTRETIPEHSELPENPIHQPLSIQHSAFSIQHSAFEICLTIFPTHSNANG